MIKTEQMEQRARDPVARYLVGALTVPKLYFEAPWPTPRSRVDVLAIDRAGSGDLHVVEIKVDATDVPKAIDQVLRIPAHFRWVAFHSDSSLADQDSSLHKSLLPPKGMGRVGVIKVVRMRGDELGANLAIRAERFQGVDRRTVVQFAKRHPADIEFGASLSDEQETSEIEILGEDEIAATLKEAQRLHSQGLDELAIVVGWVAAEAAMRRVAAREGLWVEHRAHSMLVRSLHDHGFVTARDFELLVEAAKVRNSVVHGGKISSPMGFSVSELVKAVKRLAGATQARTR